MELHSDQGRNFEFETFQDVCRLLGINKTRTIPYHPQSDGMVERFNKTIEDGLAMFVNAHHSDWDVHISLLLMAYRSAEHAATKVSPSRMMLGREIKLPIDMWVGRPDDSGVTRNIPIYAQKLQEQMDEVHIFARENLKISFGATKQFYDAKTMETRYGNGTGVWLYNPQRRKGRSPKLSRNWDGPYVVVKQNLRSFTLIGLNLTQANNLLIGLWIQVLREISSLVGKRQRTGILEIIAVIKRLDHCAAVKDVGRNRKDIRLKMSVGNCSTGTDELGRGRCSAGTAEQKGYYVYL